MVNVIAGRTGGDAGLMISGQRAMAFEIYGDGILARPICGRRAEPPLPQRHRSPRAILAMYGAGFMNGNAFMIMSVQAPGRVGKVRHVPDVG